MAQTETTGSVSKLSIVLMAAFAVLGVGLLYLYIVTSSASDGTKILWASGLSIVVAFLFAIVWAMAKDVEKQEERESRRRQVQP